MNIKILSLASFTSDNSINILKDLLKLTQNSKVVIQWIPATCGIPRNDKADLHAKDGSQQQQESPSTSYKEA
jgi:ribonuclease HI